MMVTVEQINEIKEMVRIARKAGYKIGFVPTMGYFHAGHLSLIRRAKQENNLVVASLFVNPIQFGPKEDFNSYPRDLKRDQGLAADAGADILFAPEKDEIYPSGYQTYIEVTEISRGLCGAVRPGHFKGVATVVLKLFHIVEPDRAYFGEKDAQQLRVIKRMVTDLNYRIEIIGCPIIRESDGLAMSSRNSYLTPPERRAATVLFRALQTAKQRIENGECNPQRLRQEMGAIIESEPLATPEYIEIVDSASLQPLAVISGEILIALAVRIGETRLIDNLTLSINESLISENPD
jgi:pantoate--beta-alanine ligase